MEKSIEELSQRELEQLYIRETNEFLAALQSGEKWTSLEDRRNKLRHIASLIDNKTILQMKSDDSYGIDRDRREGSFISFF